MAFEGFSFIKMVIASLFHIRIKDGKKDKGLLGL